MLSFAIVALLTIFTTSANTYPPAASNNDCSYFSYLSLPIVKYGAGNEITSANVSQLVIIFSTFSNPCSHDQQVVVVTEARDQNGATIFFQYAPVSTRAFNSSEVGMLWSPEREGTYELRSFAISNSTKSQILTSLQTSELSVVDYDMIDV